MKANIYHPYNQDRSFITTKTTTTMAVKGGKEKTNSLKSSFDLDHIDCNVSSNIASKVGSNLHQRKDHPLHIIKSKIERYWQSSSSSSFDIYDDKSPIVSTKSNFDSLLIPTDHVSRSKSDTYYLNKDTVLRTHTSAHQTELLQSGKNQFLITGDVYRRDEIDSSHYPVFHQMEGVKMFTDPTTLLELSEQEQVQMVENDLKQGLEGMTKELFGNVEMRWIDAYFPFTYPSYELEIYFENEWLEVLGCGVIHKDILVSCGRGGLQKGWAFGLGLERLAMVLYSIPDIRLFWTDDERFHKQFRFNDGSDGDGMVKFRPYSKYPPCHKDISFWTTTTTSTTADDDDDDEKEKKKEEFHPNDLNELVRDVAGDLVEQVELIDEFRHPKTNRLSNCFRISYRSMDRSLTNEEIDQLQEQVRILAVERLGVELR